MDYSRIIDIFKTVSQFKLFTVNQTPVTVISLFFFIVIIITLARLSKYASRAITSMILPRFHVEEGIAYNTSRILNYMFLLISTIFSFQFIGIDLSGLMVVFGFLSVGIGFGLQNITSNFISGIILLFERPIAVGDRVTVGGTEGDILEIRMRSTIVQSMQNISIIVPNSEFISGQVINWSHGDQKVRVGINVGVSYTSDLDSVLAALREVANEHKEVLQTPEPFVRLMDFGDSSWNMFLGAWIASPKHFYQIRSDLNCAIVRKFREKGIEIPYPQRDLHIRTPLPIPVSAASSKD
ncbi:mechanosensitive ion channel [bacterium]|nr:mechanosensitive ion channel [bacterium]